MIESKKIKLVGDRVLILPDAKKTVTDSGIYIPEIASEKPLTGVVFSVGTFPDMIVKEGDKVLFGKYSGTDFDFNGQTYLMMKESEIIAIFE